MSELDLSFKEQQRVEDVLNLRAMVIQVSVNFVFTICVFFLFCWLRPRYTFIYAPKAKLSPSDIRRPEALGPGLLDWIKPVFKIKDDELLKHIGFDAYVFIYFTRILRRLIIVITLISVFIFIPVNIVATFNTGDWPPVGLEFLSISAMNYQYGKQTKEPNYNWYWSPTIATWMFSTIVTWEMINASRKFILFRQKYYIRQEEETISRLPCMSPIELLQHQKQELISRTLLVHFSIHDKKRSNSGNNHDLIPNEVVKTMVNSISKVSCQQVLVGNHNNKLGLLMKDYKRIIKALEKCLDTYLNHIHKDGSTAKRPQIRQNWKLKKLDAINYYTDRALLLESAIRRNRLKLFNNNYGWVIYSTKNLAHEAYLSIEKSLKLQEINNLPKNYCDRIRLAPHPDDIVWQNMNIDRHTGQLKRWFGYGLFSSIIFGWSIPIATLGIMSNIINMIRLFPDSDQVLKQNQLITGLIQSYLTPCLMVLFYFGLPELLFFVSRQQAYKTETIIQQKTLFKLYAFFVINNLFIFTLVNMMVGIVGQIAALTMAGTLTDKRLSQYIVQIAKNLSDVSSFWINYLCIRSVGIIVELLQVKTIISLVLLRGKKGWFGYTPRQFEKLMGPPPFFKFAKHYGMMISFFTAALVYSVMAPIALPFALIYFGLATTTFKYKLMYIYITKVETHGKIWPLLYGIVMFSLFVFQCMMILILSLKAGMNQIYALLPLPIITVIILIYYVRYLLKHNTLKTWIELKNSIRSSSPSSSSSSPSIIELSEMNIENSNEKDEKLINLIYQDPSLNDNLWKPMLFNHLKPLVSDIYNDHPQKNRILRTLFNETTKNIKKKKKKQDTKLQLEQEMNMFHSIPHEFNDDIIDQATGSNNYQPTAPTLDLIQKPPPTYTDVILQRKRHSF